MFVEDLMAENSLRKATEERKTNSDQSFSRNALVRPGEFYSDRKTACQFVINTEKNNIYLPPWGVWELSELQAALFIS